MAALTEFHPPDFVECRIAMPGTFDAPAILNCVATSLARDDFAIAETWRIGFDGAPLPWPPKPKELSGLDMTSSVLIDGPGGAIDLIRYDDAGPFRSLPRTPPLPAWRLTWRSRELTSDLSPDRTCAMQGAAVTLARDMIRAGMTPHEAMVTRGATCFAPAPPLAPSEAVMVLVDPDDVAGLYPDAGEYWRVWDKVTPLDDGRMLVCRGIGIGDEMTFKHLTYPATWALARACRPGVCVYTEPTVAPWEQSLLDAGESALTLLGYSAAERCLDYTAFVADGMHIPPREIFALRAAWNSVIRQTGACPERIRVAFPDRAMALREIVPLLDAGAEVICFGPAGTWESVRP